MDPLSIVAAWSKVGTRQSYAVPTCINDAAFEFLSIEPNGLIRPIGEAR
jgi:hypothetical protein